MTVKLTVIYDNPADPEAFEAHYGTKHVELAAQLPDVLRSETAKVFPKEDGSPTPAYRTADIYFADYDTAVAALGSPQGQAVVADVKEIGAAGFKMLLSDVETA